MKDLKSIKYVFHLILSLSIVVWGVIEGINAYLGYTSMFVATIYLFALIGLIATNYVIFSTQSDTKVKSVISKVYYFAMAPILTLLIIWIIIGSVNNLQKLTEIASNEPFDEYIVVECTDILRDGACAIIDVETETLHTVFFDNGTYDGIVPGSFLETVR